MGMMHGLDAITKSRHIIILVGVVVLLTACAWKGGHRVGDDATTDAPGPVWSNHPWKMRVYPSTRFAQDQDQAQPLLEARVELVDDMGDPVKGVGRLRLELFTRGPTGKPNIGQRLYSWDVSILTRSDQQRHYDPITRAYLFRLKLDEPQTAQMQTVLKAMFIPPQGQRIETHASLPMNLYHIESLHPNH